MRLRWTESLSGQGQGAVNHHLFPQGRRNNVGESGERTEYPRPDQFSQRPEEEVVPHEGDSAAHHDSPRTEKCDHVADSFGQCLECVTEYLSGQSVAFARGGSHRPGCDWT